MELLSARSHAPLRGDARSPVLARRRARPAPAPTPAIRASAPDDALAGLLTRSVNQRAGTEPRGTAHAATGTLHRACCSACAAGAPCASAHHEAEEETDPLARHLRRAVLARTPLARAILARDQDPGPPQMPDFKGLTCGIKDGKPSCSIYTGAGDSLDVDPDSLTPQQRQAAFDPKRPKSCPPDRWNWFWQSCCADGKRFDPGTHNCVPVPVVEDPIYQLPPPDPEEMGDFPMPDEVYA